MISSSSPIIHHFPGLAIAMGEFADVDTFPLLGYNPDVDTGLEEPIWTVPSSAWVPFTSAQTITFVSDSTEDDTEGTGARSVRITGLNSTGIQTIETIATNGTTNVVTASLWTGINLVETVTAGSNGKNVGNITFKATTDDSIQAYVRANDGRSRQLIFNVPSDKTAYILRVRATVLDQDEGVSLRAYTITDGVTSNILNTPIGILTYFESRLVIPFPIPPSSKVYYTINTASTSNIFAEGFVELALV